MTRLEFWLAYVERSNVTTRQLVSAGRLPIVCSCDDELCEGWQMTHVDVEMTHYFSGYIWQTRCPEPDCRRRFTRKSGSNNADKMTREMRRSVGAHFFSLHMYENGSE